MGEGAAAGRRIPAVYLDAGNQESAVRAWAAGIAPAETDPGRLARAFARDLSSRPYSLDTRAVDAGHPIASFLAGAPAHCEYFASAMALGLRLRGIPARVVVGYIGSDKVPFSQTLVVRESRAHLWVEAHLPGKGWVTFDPTPPAGRVTPSEWGYLVQGAWERAVLSWDGMVIGLDIQDQADMALMARDKVLQALALLKSGGVWLILGLPVLAGAIVFASFRGRWGIRRRRLGSAEMPAFYRRLLTMAEARGLRPLPAETSREFARRVSGALRDKDAVWLVSGLYERVRFGGIPPTAAELSSIREALDRIGRQLRSSRTRLDSRGPR